MEVKKAMWMVFAIVAVILALVLANMYFNSGYPNPEEYVDQRYQE